MNTNPIERFAAVVEAARGLTMAESKSIMTCGDLLKSVADSYPDAYKNNRVPQWQKFAVAMIEYIATAPNDAALKAKEGA